VDPIVIIGTGLAGYGVARELRKLDRETPLHLITGDDAVSYSKPMLSNALASGKTADHLALASAEDMGRTLHAVVHSHTRVTALDIPGRRLRTERDEMPFGHLVLALGADPIRLSPEGDGAEHVRSVNDRGDYARFREAIAGKRHVTILGAGLIGCEFANDLRRAGYAVAVVDPAPQPLGRLLPPQAGAFLRQRLERSGVRFHFQCTAQRIDRDGARLAVTLSDGETLSTDCVLSAVGLRPRTNLAAAAGLGVGRGVRVDRCLRTSAEGVYALGDCAEVEGLVLPFVMPLMAAARALGATLAGRPTPALYPAMPVVVKTPDCPTVVCPPLAGSSGAWQETEGEEGVTSLLRDPAGRLLGFALCGDATAEKRRLAREIAPWLAAN